MTLAHSEDGKMNEIPHHEEDWRCETVRRLEIGSNRDLQHLFCLLQTKR